MATTLKTRIEARLKALGMTARGASLAAGLDADTIRNIQRGRSKEPGFDKLLSLAKTLRCSVAYLLGRVARPDDIDGVEPAPHDSFQVPVISYVEAGRWAVATDPYPLGRADDWIGVNYKVGKRTIALRVKGLSMAPDFAEGDVVIVDADVEPLPGDCVVAKLDRDDEVTFKKYRPRGKDRRGYDIIELVPLNPDYPTLVIDRANPGTIAGTMVEHRRFRRR